MYIYIYIIYITTEFHKILITDVLKRPLRRLSTINGFRKVVTSQYLSFGGRLRAPLILIRQHTSAYAYTYIHTYAHTHKGTHTHKVTGTLIQVSTSLSQVFLSTHTSAYVSIRQHTSAYAR